VTYARYAPYALSHSRVGNEKHVVNSADRRSRGKDPMGIGSIGIIGVHGSQASEVMALIEACREPEAKPARNLSGFVCERATPPIRVARNDLKCARPERGAVTLRGDRP